MALHQHVRGHCGRFFLYITCLILFGFSAMLEAGQDTTNYDRILIVRGLDHEVAVAKVPLPWGKRGICVNGKGQEDQAEALKELHSKGESVKPGIPVEITDIKFKPDRVVFAINGGGKTGEHWYQHIQLGMGGIPTPLVSQGGDKTTPSNGSYITVLLPRNDRNPTVDRLKTLLASVLDFSRRAPTVLYSPSVPPQYKEAIKNHQVVPGMDKISVLSAKGPPDRKVRKDLPDGSQEEDWLYGDPPHVLFVIFLNDTVEKTQQY